jgi:hypothetical protein
MILEFAIRDPIVSQALSEKWATDGPGHVEPGPTSAGFPSEGNSGARRVGAALELES